MVFGDLHQVCRMVAMPFCPLIGYSPITHTVGVQPVCYARTLDLANTIIFNTATCFVHIIALLMTVVMIIHVRSKFTAVGRKEITTFFYLYMLLTVISLILDAGVVPLGSPAYPYMVGIQIGLSGALCLSLMINGFVGFQLYEDGTKLSVWLLRIASIGWFAITFLVALLTFKNLGGLGPENTTGLFVIMFIFNPIFLVVYIVMQILLVLNTLQDRWPLGHIVFGIFFFVLGQVILYTLSRSICERIQHYLDGLAFATLCNLLAVMMVYKYWDSITREDLEFSVGARTNNWDVKEFMPVGQDEPYEDNVVRSSVFYGGKGNEASNSSLPSPGLRHSVQERSGFI